MPKPYRNGGQPDIVWSASGFKSAVFVEGTLNNPTDTDKKWTVEVAIPFSSLKITDLDISPKNGDSWKINFSRVEWQIEIVNGKYQKIKDSNNNHFLSENNWVWSPQGIINMHFPERWGLATFLNLPVDAEKITFQYPEEEILGKYLWMLYYKQQNFRKTNGKFAGSYSELNLVLLY